MLIRPVAPGANAKLITRPLWFHFGWLDLLENFVEKEKIKTKALRVLFIFRY